MTESPFIRCDNSTTEGYKTTPHFIKVLLNPDVKIYPNEYKGIKFFVSKDVLNKSTGWRTTEIKSGASVERYPYRHNTKKGCIAEAHTTIDALGDRINGFIDEIVESYPFDEMMTQDAYMER
jgi:hypothetical protein